METPKANSSFLIGLLLTSTWQYLFCFQVTYCTSLLFIKGSFCFTLLRIVVLRVHRIIIWITLVFATLSTLTVIIGLLLICNPISAAWNDPAKCAPTVVIASLGYLVSTAAVAVDFTCSVLPTFILYKAHMKRKTKISVGVILGLAFL